MLSSPPPPPPFTSILTSFSRLHVSEVEGAFVLLVTLADRFSRGNNPPEKRRRLPDEFLSYLQTHPSSQGRNTRLRLSTLVRLIESHNLLFFVLKHEYTHMRHIELHCFKCEHLQLTINHCRLLQRVAPLSFR